jgi:hypothetical protein
MGSQRVIIKADYFTGLFISLNAEYVGVDGFILKEFIQGDVVFA